MMSTETEKHAHISEDMMLLKEQHHNEVSSKEDIIEKLSSELQKSQDAIDNVSIQ